MARQVPRRPRRRRTIIQFNHQITIERSPDEVFHYLADPTKAPEWHPAVDISHSEMAGPHRIGSTFRHVRTAPYPQEDRMTIAEMEAPHRLGVTGRLGPYHATIRYQLQPVEDGTRLHSEVAVRTGGPLGALRPFAIRRLKREVRGGLAGMKRLLESPSRTARSSA